MTFTYEEMLLLKAKQAQTAKATRERREATSPPKNRMIEVDHLLEVISEHKLTIDPWYFEDWV
jgi:hypothetical protein